MVLSMIQGRIINLEDALAFNAWNSHKKPLACFFLPKKNLPFDSPLKRKYPEISLSFSQTASPNTKTLDPKDPNPEP